ncbi:MAG: Glycosyl transferase family 2 [Candidatus Curtissbacteria bacterium GW2011_GWA1_41_11]|uniref:Glycosyl transferase family 2 n=1 Tax=Candidatus Curtissbacteria bacterium GW2011_GWA1_41_11 TaxID=1618409 RepID=A0A0G0UE91_9BACT|nr:MAG: Glycosyl transferase family 2 [Candidatus Curtissbacteria bacterium GW2011_GWA1_41_11]
MIIGFYNPYFDGFGGGERYTLTLASHWSKLHEVHLFWDDENIISESSQSLNLDLSRVKVVRNIFREQNLFKKLFLTQKYDVIFFLTDGSIPTSLARHNILHVQIPFPIFLHASWKLSRYSAIVANSNFTKYRMDPRVGKRAQVIYPPVSIKNFVPAKKEKLIISVGRFNPLKKQDVLIEAFKKMHERDFRLVLAGGLLPADRDYFSSLKNKAAKGVELVPNIPFKELQSLYGKAMVYWHAAGFGESDPTHMEHFGITTVEAMAAGCIPVVFNGGGQSEIIEEEKSGFLWNTPDELIKKTENIRVTNNIVSAVREKARAFDTDVFKKKFDQLLMRLVQ